MEVSRYSLVIIICLFFSPLEAQYVLGLKSGMTKAWEEYGNVDLPADANISVRGLQLSASFYYTITSKVWLGAEPGYVERGAACKPGFVIFNRDARLRLNYVELPFFVAMQLPLIKEKLFIRPKAGLGGGLVLSAFEEQIDLETGSRLERNRLYFDDADPMRRWDYGLYSGLALSYSIGKHQVLIEGNYYHGIPDVDPNLTSRNRSLNASLGLMLHL